MLKSFVPSSTVNSQSQFETCFRLVQVNKCANHCKFWMLATLIRVSKLFVSKNTPLAFQLVNNRDLELGISLSIWNQSILDWKYINHIFNIIISSSTEQGFFMFGRAEYVRWKTSMTKILNFLKGQFHQIFYCVLNFKMVLYVVNVEFIWNWLMVFCSIVWATNYGFHFFKCKIPFFEPTSSRILYRAKQFCEGRACEA